jgi:hypothetical protein
MPAWSKSLARFRCELRRHGDLRDSKYPGFPLLGGLVGGRDHDVATGLLVGLRLFCGAENLSESSDVSLDKIVRMFVECVHGNDGCSHEGVE